MAASMAASHRMRVLLEGSLCGRGCRLSGTRRQSVRVLPVGIVFEEDIVLEVLVEDDFDRPCLLVYWRLDGPVACVSHARDSL